MLFPEINPRTVHFPSARDPASCKGSTSEDMTRYLKQNAVCVINCSWDKSELEKQLPAKMRKDLAEKQAIYETGETASC